MHDTASWMVARQHCDDARVSDQPTRSPPQAGQVFESSVGYDLPTGDTLEPDVSFISAERFAAAPPKTPNEFLRIVPSLVVEVLSASTAKRDQTEKKDIYEANGVDEYWIVDARRKLVPVFYREEHGYGAAQFFRRGLIRSRALPRLRVSVDAVFRGP
jgi:Uma2 family endonuclease